MTKKIPQSLASLYSKPASSSDKPNFIPFMKIDYEEDGYKIRIKEDDKMVWKNIGDDLKVQILLITTYYNSYNTNTNSVDIETNKATPGEDITIYNYENNTYNTVSPEDFKALKTKMKAEGINLKFNRALMVKILEGEYKDQVFELSVKLSQSHGIDNNKHYLFDDPIEGSLAQYLKACDNVYPSRILEMSVRSYSRGAINIKYPYFRMEKEITINEEEIKDTIKRTKESDTSKEKKMDEHIFKLD